MKGLNAYHRCTAYCTAEGYDLLGLASYFKKRSYQTQLSRDVLQVSNSDASGELFFFNHGSFVSWGFKKSFDEKLLQHLSTYSTKPLSQIETDEFYYEMGSECNISIHEVYHIDIITLDTEELSAKLAISYALAQSIKLEAFEEAVKEVIKKNIPLPEEVASRGTITLSRRAIFKRMGEIFIVRSSINLNIEYLDAPEFFWRHPNVEPFYIMTKKYLDIASRVMSLNQKLGLLQELLDMLNSQVEQRHSSLLESIIILLIAVEIVISLFQFHVV